MLTNREWEQLKPKNEKWSNAIHQVWENINIQKELIEGKKGIIIFIAENSYLKPVF